MLAPAFFCWVENPKIMFKWWPPANCPENTCHKMFKLIFYCTGSLNEIAPNDVCTFLLLLNLFWNLEPWAFLPKQLPQLHHKGFCVWFIFLIDATLHFICALKSGASLGTSLTSRKQSYCSTYLISKLRIPWSSVWKFLSSNDDHPQTVQ